MSEQSPSDHFQYYAGFFLMIMGITIAVGALLVLSTDDPMFEASAAGVGMAGLGAVLYNAGKQKSS